MNFLFLLVNPDANMIGIDPTPFTAWGVLGLLAVVVLVLVGIIWKLFNKSTAAMESQTKTLMDFVNGHRRETTLALDTMTDKTNKAMDDVANKVVSSQDRMVDAFGKMSKMINELVLLERIYDRASKRKGEVSGTSGLSDDEIEKIVRRVKSGNGGN